MKDEGIMIIYTEMSTGVPAEVIVIEWRDLGRGQWWGRYQTWQRGETAEAAADKCQSRVP